MSKTPTIDKYKKIFDGQPNNRPQEIHVSRKERDKLVDEFIKSHRTDGSTPRPRKPGPEEPIECHGVKVKVV